MVATPDATPSASAGRAFTKHHRQGAATVERCRKQHRNDGADSRPDDSVDDLPDAPLAGHLSGPSGIISGT